MNENITFNKSQCVWLPSTELHTEVNVRKYKGCSVFHEVFW